MSQQNKTKKKRKKNHLLHAGVISKASETHQSNQSVRDGRPSKHCHLHQHTHTYAHTCTPADRYGPLTSHWPLYEVINLLKRLGSFFMAGVAGSRQDSKRVHVHLMAHERTMATALSASQAPAALGWALTPVDGWAVGINGSISHSGEIRQHFSDDVLRTLPPLSESASWPIIGSLGGLEKVSLNANICLQFFQGCFFD